MPDDDWFDKIDPILKLWLYNSWQQDLIDKNDFAKNYSILIGSFTNYKMAQKMLDGNNTVVSNEEEYEKSTQIMLEDREKKTPKRMSRRKRRQLLNKETNG